VPRPAACCRSCWRGPRSGKRIPITLGGLVTLLWAGRALALVSWLLAIGAVLVALAGGVRSEPDR
jgi:hypothetical protein